MTSTVIDAAAGPIVKAKSIVSKPQARNKNDSADNNSQNMLNKPNIRIKSLFYPWTYLTRNEKLEICNKDEKQTGISIVTYTNWANYCGRVA